MLEARYDEAMAYSDSYAGPFLQRALALLGPNTAIIVSADHGESFSHGYGAHTGPGLYDEIIHIPLILKLPGETTGKRCERPAEQADIAPTLAALAGVPAPADWAGRSLLSACNAARPARLAAAARDLQHELRAESRASRPEDRLGRGHPGPLEAHPLHGRAALSLHAAAAR